MVFSPDGRLLSATTDRGLAHVWDVESGAQVALVRGNNALTASSAFHPDGHTFGTGGGGGEAALWDLRQCAGYRWWSLPPASRAVLSPDAKTLLVARHTELLAYDVVTERKVAARGGIADNRAVGFTAGSAALAVAIADPGGLLLDARLDSVEGGPPGGPTSHAADLAGDAGGRTLVAADRHEILLRDAPGRPWRALPTPEEMQRKAVAITADGFAIAYQLDITTVALHRRADDKILQLPTSGRVVTRLRFSPDGRRLAALGDQSAFVWDASTGVALHKIALSGAEGDLAFSRDGRTLAIGTRHPGTVSLWSTHTGQRTLLLLDNPRFKIESVAFADDGLSLVAAGPGPHGTVVHRWHAAP